MSSCPCAASTPSRIRRPGVISSFRRRKLRPSPIPSLDGDPETNPKAVKHNRSGEQPIAGALKQDPVTPSHTRACKSTIGPMTPPPLTQTAGSISIDSNNPVSIAGSHPRRLISRLWPLNYANPPQVNTTPTISGYSHSGVQPVQLRSSPISPPCSYAAPKAQTPTKHMTLDFRSPSPEKGRNKFASWARNRLHRGSSVLSLPLPIISSPDRGPATSDDEGNTEPHKKSSGLSKRDNKVESSTNRDPSATKAGSEQPGESGLPLSSRRHLESSEGRAQPSNNLQVTDNSVISSLLSCSQVIVMLEERGCENLSSYLDPQACSKYPVYKGGFGDVYVGRLRSGTKVAIKTMRPHSADDFTAGKYQKRSAKELYTWSKCDHPNVTKLLGLAEFRGYLAMVSNWAENGNLTSYIRNNPSVDRRSLIAPICEGLAYLHGSEIVHGDLKGANILVSDDGTPMLTDFGNASLGESTVTFTTTPAGPSFSLRWTAPEIIEGSSQHSFAGDIYALGMTILETIIGQVPFSDIREVHIPRTVLDKKQTPPRPEEIPTQSAWGNALWELLTNCWDCDPELRPSAAQVRDKVRDTILPLGTLAHVELRSDLENGP